LSLLLRLLLLPLLLLHNEACYLIVLDCFVGVNQLHGPRSSALMSPGYSFFYPCPL